MKKNARNKMTLTRQTIRSLDAKVLERVDGGAPTPTFYAPCLPPPP